MGFGFGFDDFKKRYPPRRRMAPPDPGQSYFEMVEKHGRPFGPFDKERKLPYDARPVPVRREIP
jgi:hypothetical protein